MPSETIVPGLRAAYNSACRKQIRGA